MHLQELRSKIHEIAQPLLSRRDAFLVDLQVRMERRALLVQVFADTDSGITIQQCAEINRDLAGALNSGAITGDLDLRLEVSSPGIDRPLTMLRQYQKNIGRKFKVRYREGPDVKTVSANLLSVDGDRLTFDGPAGSFSVTFDTIVESKEELPW